MNPNEAIHDPVFQLNLLVWMAKEQPQNGYRVRPFFHEHGFQLHYIEQPFPFPTEARNLIESTAQSLSLEINLNPEPELTIQRHTDGRAIYFEAKAQGFSQESSNSRQARGHLLACGLSFAEVYKPLAGALLDYVVPSEDMDSMRNCLSMLKTGLKLARLEAGDFAVDGLSIRGTELAYHLDKPISALLSTSEIEVAVMKGLDQETDPSPLLLVYSDEDCPDSARAGYYRRVLQNQAVANLLCILHRRTDEQILEISAQELLTLTTIGVFEFLGRGRQKSMERVITENIFRRIFEHWKERLPNKIRFASKTIIFEFKNPSDRETVLDWLEDVKRVGFDDKKPDNQPELFSS